jgi:DNA (cytosine-5)-methyltransferase 1
MLILSLFPGVDMLGYAFALEGYCVVRGPDIIYGQDIRDFIPPPDVFYGVIGGSPCQDFSAARRDPPTGYGLEMLAQFARVVLRARPNWWLLENVPAVPDIRIEGYPLHQRLDIKASEFGLSQTRLRHYQFGAGASNRPLLLPRQNLDGSHPTVLAHDKRPLEQMCQLQGFPPERLEYLPFTEKGKRIVIGNGVPVPVGRALARAIRDGGEGRPCACSCGRVVTGRQQSALPACRKRRQRQRENPIPALHFIPSDFVTISRP